MGFNLVWTERFHLSRRASRQNGEELIATHARGKVRQANCRIQAPGEFFQYQIAGRVTIRIVDPLEFIEVEGNHCQRMAMTLRSGSLRCQPLFSDTPVVQPRQWIHKRQPVKFFCAELEELACLRSAWRIVAVTA